MKKEKITTTFTSPLGAFSKNSAQLFIVFVLLALAIGFLVFFVYRDRVVLSDLSVSSIAAQCQTCSQVVLPQDSVLLGGYSQPGTKRALLFGCNYSFPGSVCIASGCTLEGCINDVNEISTLLSTCGFSSSNIQLFVDDGSTAFPSKQFFITSLNSFVSLMQPGDISFIWYSGHGAQIANAVSDGGYNECWCPPDTLSNGAYLTDDQLNAIVRKAPAGSTLFVGSDSCHSGTVFDLQYTVQDPSGANANRGLGLLGAIRGKVPLTVFPPFHTNTNVKQKIVSANALAIASPTTATEEIASRGERSQYVVYSDSSFPATNACIISLSGCQDYDVSADAYIENEGNGAMTWAFKKSFSPDSTLTSLLINMRKLLKANRFTQVPQICMGNLLNPNLTTLKQIFQI